LHYKNEKAEIDIYDLPGFDDNRGAETDIENCLEIFSIIKHG
jgi:hypothetical protein